MKYVQKERVVADIPADLKLAVQKRLLELNKTLTELIIELLEDWLKKQEL